MLLPALQDRVVRMQQALAKVWHRFAYTSHPGLTNDFKDALQGQEMSDRGKTVLQEQDAFATIIQWLYGRMGDVAAAREQIARSDAGANDGSAY